VKVLSGMDIAEHRLPQDGRFSVSVGARRLDLRSSTYPTLHGEKAVLRLLDRSSLRLHLETMGMRGLVLEQFRDLIRRPEGMLLITGPTGSGKTSTLYAALTELVETGKHIITIEDPVEYALEGVNQGQTNEKAGFTFASWSARFAIQRRCRPPSRHRSPAISCSRPCTRTAHLRPRRA
jgi:type II secretory ATPase GspE/PulE/Tfp pilus assembly ATPase PilB-like protein